MKTLPALLIVAFLVESTRRGGTMTCGERDAHRPATVKGCYHCSPRRQQRIAARCDGGNVERSDTIPPFVEEMTKAVFEVESEGVARRTLAVVPSPALAVPASLHGR